MNFIGVVSQDRKRARAIYIQSLCLTFAHLSDFLTARVADGVTCHDNFFLLPIDLSVIDL